MIHTLWSKKRRKSTSSIRQGHQRLAGAPPAFDSLEPRLLLAIADYVFLTGTQLTLRGGAATSVDSITLSRSGSDIVATIDVSNDFLGGGNLAPFTSTLPAAAIASIKIEAGGANDTINVNSLGAGTPLLIDSGDGTDTINIGGGNMSNIASNVNMADITAGDVLNINDASATVSRNVTLTNTTITGMGPGVITYVPADLTQLNINGGASGNIYTINNAGATGSPLITTLNCGNGVDNVFVNATTGRLNVYGMHGLDNVRVGNAGSLAAIRGEIFINNVNNRSAIFIDDYASTTAKNWNLTHSAIGLAPAQINYVGSSMRLLEINLGTADDIANIFGSSALDTRITSAAGNEIINFFNGAEATPLARPLTISNTLGQSSLFVDASGDNVARSLTITRTGITGVGAGSILFDPSDIAGLSMVGGSAGNTYNIVSTIPGKNLTISGGSGSDTAIVRGPFTSKIVFSGGPNRIGPGDSLQVIGTGGEHAVYTPSSVSAGDGAIAVGGQLILFTGLEPVTASNLASMTLVTPNTNDVITIDSPAAGRNRISGTSGGVAFESLTVFSVPTLTLDLAKNDGAGEDDSLTINSSGLVATGLTSFNLDAGGGNNSFSIQGGTAKLNNANPSLGNLQVNASGSAVLTLSANQRLAGLNISGTARVNVPAAGSYVHLGGLSIAPTATLDIFDNDLIIQSTSTGRAALLNAINGYIRTGRAGGLWNGAGLRSSSAGAVAARNVTLAAILNDRGNGTVVRSELDGQSADVNTILIRYTYDGDSDVNGLLDADDYARMDAGYANRAIAKGFYNGDLDYSGTVDSDDYFLIDRASATASAPLGGSVLQAASVSGTPAGESATAEGTGGDTAGAPAPAETSTKKRKKRKGHHRRQGAGRPVNSVQVERLARFFRSA